MTASDELVLSDVHLFTENNTCNVHTTSVYDATSTSHSDSTRVSRFHFTKKSNCASQQDIKRARLDPETVISESGVDEDGDFLVIRKANDEHVIYIEHSLQTPLSRVGSQVWFGSLLLCDYLVHNPAIVCDKVVLELGAGVGLASIVAALNATGVISTDYREDILQIAERNVAINNHLSSDGGVLPVTFAKLDWFDTVEDGSGTGGSGTGGSGTGGSGTGWSGTDGAMTRHVSVLLAADVIYDEDITDAFFRTAYSLLKKSNITLLMSIEKRFVFTINDLDTVCPAYSHFMECIRDLSNLSTDTVKYEAAQIPADFPLYFCYDRSRHLELWEITSCHDCDIMIEADHD